MSDQEKIEKLEENVEHLEKELESLTKLASDRKKEIEKLQGEISALKVEKSTLSDQLTRRNTEYAELEAKRREGELENKALQDKLNDLHQIREKDQSEKEILSETLEKNFFNSMLKTDNDVFYEGIIRVSSLKGLEQGWEVYYRDFEHYNKKAKDPSVILSVIGNYNKGKTWLLGKLCELSGIPQGFSCSTEGISFVYTTKEDESKVAPVLALDTQGGSTPIRIDGIIDEIGAAASKGELQNKEDVFSKKFKEKLTDHLSTEDLLHAFISTKSTVNLIVVSDLTFEDQRLINKLKKRQAKTMIVVVHNLYHCTRIEEVENVKLKEIILPSFDLVEKKYGFETSGNHRYFEEDLHDRTIVHLIMAKDNTEAGKHYNPASLKYLKQLYEVAATKVFNVVDEFRSFLKNNLQTYMQIDDKFLANMAQDEKKLENGQISHTIRLPGSDKVELKSVSADESGMLNTSLQSYCIIADPKESRIIVKIECPGAFDSKTILVRIEPQDTEYRLWIKGRKANDDNEIKELDRIHDIRKQGEFMLVTPWISSLKYDILGFKNTKKVEFSNGCVLISYQYEARSDWD